MDLHSFCRTTIPCFPCTAIEDMIRDYSTSSKSHFLIFTESSPHACRSGWSRLQQHMHTAAYFANLWFRFEYSRVSRALPVEDLQIISPLSRHDALLGAALRDNGACLALRVRRSCQPRECQWGAQGCQWAQGRRLGRPGVVRGTPKQKWRVVLRKIQREGLQRSVKLHMVQTSMAWWLQQTPVMRVKNGQDVSKHALHAPCDANQSLVCVQVAEACCHPAALLDSRPFGVGSKKPTPASLRKLSKLKSLRLSPRSWRMHCACQTRDKQWVWIFDRSGESKVPGSVRYSKY